MNTKFKLYFGLLVATFIALSCNNSDDVTIAQDTSITMKLSNFLNN